MNFKEWFKTNYRNKIVLQAVKEDFEDCWKEGQKELADDPTIKDSRGQAWWFQRGKEEGKTQLANEVILIGKTVYKNDSKAGAYDAMMFKLHAYYEKSKEEKGK